MPPEITSQFTITDRMLNHALDLNLDQRITQMLVNQFSERFMVNASRPKGVTRHWERDASLRGWEVTTFAEEDLSDPSLRQLLVRADIQKMSFMAALFAVNELSWWRFLWLKLRGRPVVEYKGQ